jgi:PAS domain S-box-containing protein
LSASELDRTQALAALEQTGRRFQDLLEAVPAVIYEAEPGPEGRWRYVSPQLRWILGEEPEDWMADSRCWSRRLHPDDRDAIFHMEDSETENARGESASFVSEYRMLHRDGRVVWVRDEARLVTDTSGPPFWRGVLVDITAERTAGNALAETYRRVRSREGDEDIAEAGGRDVFRVDCATCGAVTASIQPSPCGACGSNDVEAESMDQLLDDLKDSRQEVSDLLTGIHHHLETLGTSLHGGGGPEPPPRVVSRLPNDPLANP